jgi:hypothetical protein
VGAVFASLIEPFRLSGTAAVIDRTVKGKSRKRGEIDTEVEESLITSRAGTPSPRGGHHRRRATAPRAQPLTPAAGSIW